MAKKIPMRLLTPRRWAVLSCTVLLAAASAVVPLSAQPLDDTFTYQGSLEESGSPADGEFDFVMNLYDDPDPLAGTLIATTTLLDVTVMNGLFTIEVDLGDVWNGEQRWLEIEVADGSGVFVALAPTQPVTPTPNAHFARRAGDAAQLGGVEADQYLQSNDGDLALAGVLQTGSAGIAVSYNRLGVETQHSGLLSTSDDLLISDDLEVVGTAWVDRLVVGGASDTNDGVILLDGNETITWDESDNRFTISDEVAVQGPIRVGSVLNSPVGYSMFGGFSSSGPASGAINLVGDVYIDDDLEVGDEIFSSGPLHVGLAEGDHSIYFYAEGKKKGSRFYWDGTFDHFRLTDTLDIAGDLVAAGKRLRIDHPLDPEGKYLYHASIESPDMMTVYNGNVTTDEHGEAIVELPSYFEALNRDFRYQLTPIGVFAQAIIAEEITDNRFVVRTDKPNVKVSWQVTGIRQDSWANDHRVIPEVEKSTHE